MKKFIALFLSALIAVTSFPVISFAAEDDSEKWSAFYDEVTEFTVKHNDIEYFEPITVIDNKAYKEGEDIDTKIVDDVLYVDSKELGSDAAFINDENTITENNTTYIPIDDCSDELAIETIEGDNSTIYCKPYQTKRLIVDYSGELPEVNEIDSLETPDGDVILQFGSESEAKNAYDILNNSDNVKSVSGENTYSCSAFSASDFPLNENLSWGADYVDSPQAVSYSKEKNLNKNVTVAVIDSGVDIDHPYLQGRILSNSKSVISNSYNDEHSHGTHVSGIIVDNTPDNVKILAVQALGADGKGTDYQIASALNYAVSQKVDVINMSLGGLDVWNNSVLKTAIKNAYDNNITICVSAGNESDDAGYYYPANSPYCITVGAISSDGYPGYYSNYGSVVDVSAPGSAILSSVIDGDYAEYSGTSMAAPFVSSACAMKIILSGKESPSKTKAYIKKNVIKHKDGSVDEYGTGIISLTKYLPEERTAPVCFNKLGGYYQDKSLSISMTSADKSAKIYYTTDGSEPSDSNGVLYSKPITITENTTFKAVAYSGSKYKSKITKAPYIFGHIAKESDFKVSGRTIVDYYGPSGDIVIPEKIYGNTINVIGEKAFKDNQITSVIIPRSVIKISDYAFADNNLDYVDAQGVTYIGSNAFAKNSSLSDTKFGQVNYVGMSAFEDCNINQDSIDISSVAEIGKRAFYNCNFTELYKSSALTKIGESAFENNDLFSVDMPSVKTIGNNAFCANKNLKSVKLSSVTEIGTRAFYNCASLDNVSLAKAEIIGAEAFAYCNLNGKLSFPKVKKVCDGAFSYTNISTLNLPSAVEIGSIECSYFLESLNIGNCYTASKNFKISYCSSLKTFNAPLLTIMPDISNCSRLEIINLPNAVEMSNGTLSSLSQLKTINLSALSKMPAISDCPSLETAIFTSAESLSPISNCRSLKNLIVPNLKNFSDSLLKGSMSNISSLNLDSAESVTLTSSENTVYNMPVLKKLNSNNTAVLSVAVPKTAKLSNVSQDSCIYTSNAEITGCNVINTPVIKTDLPNEYVLDADTADALSLTVYCAKPSYKWQYSENSDFSTYSDVNGSSRNIIIPDKSGYYRCVVTDTESGSKVISSVCNVSCNIDASELVFNSTKGMNAVWNNTFIPNIKTEIINIPADDEISVYEDVNIKALRVNGAVSSSVNGLYNIIAGDGMKITADTRNNLQKAKIVSTSNKDNHYGSYYSGVAREPMLKLVYNNKELVKNKDYIIRIVSNTEPVEPDTYNFIIIGLGDYYGRISDKFDIHYASIDDCEFTSIKPQVYTGRLVQPEIKASIDGNPVDTFDVYYVDNIGIGTATATVYGRGYIDGEKDIKFRIGYDLSLARVTLDKNTCYHSDINPCKPKATVTYYGRTLKENRDFKVSYKNNNTVGTATVVVTGIGNYVNSSNAYFKIIDGVPFEPKLSKTSFVYNGAVQRPTVTVKDNKGKSLTYKKDFTVDYSNWSSTNAGTYKVTVNFIGSYCGSKTYTYKITAQSNVTSKLSSNNYTYNGKIQKPSVIVKDSKGNTLKLNKDYTAVYSDANSKNIGKYTVTIKFKGNYSGSKTIGYCINPKGTEFVPSSKGGFKAISKGFTLKWNKQASQTTGYQIQYATRSDFSNAATVTITNPNTTSTTIKGRAGNTRYYVRVRTYKKVNGKTFFSGWNSGTKSVVTLR